MSDELSPAAERVQELLRAADSKARVRQLPVTARTSADAAAAIGCTVAQIDELYALARAWLADALASE